MSHPTDLQQAKTLREEIQRHIACGWPCAEKVDRIIAAALAVAKQDEQKELEWLRKGEAMLRREVFGYVNGSWGCRDPKKYIREQLDKWLADKPQAQASGAVEPPAGKG